MVRRLNIITLGSTPFSRLRTPLDRCILNLELDELLAMTDDELYRLFYPEKFKAKKCYAPVDYAYVHSELGKVGVTEYLLWEEYVEKCKKEGTKPCSYPTFARGYKQYTVDSTTEKTKEIGVNTHTVVCRLYRKAKVQEQALMDVRSVLDIANLYNDEILEEACRLALKDFHKITYNTLMPYVKILSKDKKFSNETTIEKKSKGIVSAATNLIITGPTGAGKTYLSCVVGVEACKQTLRTCYIRMPDMLAHFQNHKDNLREQVRYRKKLGNYKVLIIDEWFNYKINERESKFIYELIEQRCGKKERNLRLLI